jgi:tryptophanyl-tRNA synthetase
VMDLGDPKAKMSKSLPPGGTIYLTDTPAAARKKIMRATTDSDTVIRADPDKPGVTNLLGLLSEFTGRDVPTLEKEFEGQGYGALKGALADAVTGFLEPYQQRVAELTADPDSVDEVLAVGAARAREVAAATLARARAAVGFLPVRG